ncbi:hypothetical protein B0H13DRAFT_1872250 [Mycena leptocephala]|nr:hypothetical protein B0H13DRAFT_1872250 [Mycena leptocephala]
MACYAIVAPWRVKLPRDRGRWGVAMSMWTCGGRCDVYTKSSGGRCRAPTTVGVAWPLQRAGKGSLSPRHRWTLSPSPLPPQVHGNGNVHFIGVQNAQITGFLWVGKLLPCQKLYLNKDGGNSRLIGNKGLVKGLSECGNCHYKPFYDLVDGEEIELKRISKKKKRKSSKKQINFRISPEHSTEAALGDFSKALRADSEHEDDANESSSSSRSPSPDPTRDVGAESTLRVLSPDEDLPLASALLGTPQLHILCNEPTASSSDLVSSLAISDPLLNETVLPVATIDSTSNNPGSSETITQPDLAQNELATEVASSPQRSRRVPARRQIIVSCDECEEGCSAPSCTITEDEPLVTCSEPTCKNRAHLCCVGLDVTWFRDGDCLENAGGRVRKKRRT